MKLIVILILWAMAVTNTELLIMRNHLEQDPSAQSRWQFGQVCAIQFDMMFYPILTLIQVLPMFLLVQPFLNLISTFTKYRLSPRVARPALQTEILST